MAFARQLQTLRSPLRTALPDLGASSSLEVPRKKMATMRLKNGGKCAVFRFKCPFAFEIYIEFTEKFLTRKLIAVRCPAEYVKNNLIEQSQASVRKRSAHLPGDRISSEWMWFPLFIRLSDDS